MVGATALLFGALVRRGLDDPDDLRSDRLADGALTSGSRSTGPPWLRGTTPPSDATEPPVESWNGSRKATRAPHLPAARWRLPDGGTRPGSVRKRCLPGWRRNDEAVGRHQLLG